MMKAKQGCLTVLLGTLATGCGPSVLATPGSSTGGASATSSDASTSGTTSATTDLDGTTTSATTTSTASTTSGSAPDDGTGCAGFLCEPDGGSYYGECSIWTQNCSPGEKCNPFADDGGSAWNAWRCVPVAADPDPAGSPCTADGLSGVDSCELGAMCWRVDQDTGIGTCTPHCSGSNTQVYCTDPARTCSIGGSGVIALCLVRCDPLLQDCSDGEGCYPDDWGFGCFPEAVPESALFEPCEGVSECAPGSICVNSAAIDACDNSTVGCCTSYCDLGEDTCPDATSCTAWFEPGQTPPGYEHVGACLSPTD